jgi:hypothetical protein
LGADERTGLTAYRGLTEVLSGRRTVASAAVVLAITARQVNRLLIRLRYDKHSTESALHHFFLERAYVELPDHVITPQRY